MTYHNEECYDNGYNSDGKLPYFDVIADLGEDPEKYNKNLIKITAPLEDLSTLIAKETTAANQDRLDSLTVEAAKRLKAGEIQEELKRRVCKSS